MEPIRGKTEINDPFYRYKMTKLSFKKEKTKTLILNLDKIATEIKVDFKFMISFLKNKLATAIKLDNTDTNHIKVIISNQVDINLVQTSLYEFIEIYVLCPKCKLPEVIMEDKLYLNCDACSTRSLINVTK